MEFVLTTVPMRYKISHSTDAMEVSVIFGFKVPQVLQYIHSTT